MQTREEILESIKASRTGIRVVNSCIKTFPELKATCHEIIQKEQANIKKYYSQLVKLGRRK